MTRDEALAIRDELRLRGEQLAQRLVELAADGWGPVLDLDPDSANALCAEAGIVLQVDPAPGYAAMALAYRHARHGDHELADAWAAVARRWEDIR